MAIVKGIRKAGEETADGPARADVPGARPGARAVVRAGSEAGIGLVEVLIAVTILAVGLLSIAGISLSVGAQTRWSSWQTDQALAGQSVLERVHREGYAAASSGTDTVMIGDRLYTVNRQVTQVSSRVKEVKVTVSAVGDVQPRSFVTRLHEARQLPAPPSP